MTTRRKFITMLGGAAVTWPLAARGQQPAIPIIGSLHSASDKGTEHFMDAFRQGLKETGFVEGQNVRIEYRWAYGAYDRLPSLTNDLLGLRVNVIVPFGTSAIRAAKVAYATSSATEIPIVFAAGNDPVADGIVASLNRPGADESNIGKTLANLTTHALLTKYTPFSPNAVCGGSKSLRPVASRLGSGTRLAPFPKTRLRLH